MSHAATGFPRGRALREPVLMGDAFRPFFLGASVWAALAMALWLLAYPGLVTLPTLFDPVLWHAHELLFGFVTAAIAGFVLTAIPHWTGRMPLHGRRLAALVALWAAGRIAVAFSTLTGASLAAGVDVAFLGVLLVVVLREILAGGNWRNLPVLLALAGLLLANTLTHAEAAGTAPASGLGLRLAIAVIVLLISLVGGRIVPSFTRGYLKARGRERPPAPFGVIDRVSLLVVAIACALWVVSPESAWTGVALASAGAATLLRLARWRGHRVHGEAMIWSLHVGFAWVGAGLLLLANAIFNANLSVVAGLHALTIGAMGTMTLAVMARVTLRRLGLGARADAATTIMFCLISAAVVFRLAALDPPAGVTGTPYLWDAGLCWLTAFALFIGRYGRLLLIAERRPAASPARNNPFEKQVDRDTHPARTIPEMPKGYPER